MCYLLLEWECDIVSVQNESTKCESSSQQYCTCAHSIIRAEVVEIRELMGLWHSLKTVQNWLRSEVEDVVRFQKLQHLKLQSHKLNFILLLPASVQLTALVWSKDWMFDYVQGRDTDWIIVLCQIDIYPGIYKSQHVSTMLYWASYPSAPLNRAFSRVIALVKRLSLSALMLTSYVTFLSKTLCLLTDRHDASIQSDMNFVTTL